MPRWMAADMAAEAKRRAKWKRNRRALTPGVNLPVIGSGDCWCGKKYGHPGRHASVRKSCRKCRRKRIPLNSQGYCERCARELGM